MKAVIPAAGFGTRFLPLTKAQPKEMLPVVNKPTIQWVVEEAVDAGISDIAIITGEHKQSIENHFKPMEKLEKALEKSGKFKELEKVKKVNEIANLEFIIQEEQKGLGHAILCAENFVGNDSFAVLLGDTICTGTPNCTKGLVELYSKKGSSVFSVEKIEPDETKRYGIVSGREVEENVMLVDALVEKPELKNAPSLLGIQGRYVFTPELFKHLKKTSLGSGGEIQLTDAMQSLSQVQNLYSWTFNGKRYDIGTMKDWFESHLSLSINSEYSSVLEGVLKKL
ncbi:MAG: UTP--glucose-1-phosphate uridylyltransferase [Marine Group III euryarchaeote CG-Epi6]|uniref:UTP--glucose-1-phosphate uridylyltransferase n=1 Tax=Marine Group III euryarchaeote CG-Epi6 TaxID=1889000 RepID=A0A1J5SP08_9ARCH|nr:MAG: UTP--glucose-1-phosphate uridylyltransferase [Marine Group III euryarchaeote CG-Epi6]